MNLLTLLPILDGWVWSPKDTGTKTILAGKELEIEFIPSSPGWLWTLALYLSDPDVILSLTGDIIYKQELTPYEVHTAGLTAPNNSVFCTAYTTGPPPVYGLSIAPALPFPFKRSLKIVLKNPTVSTVILYDYTHLLVVIEDVNVFRESIKEVLGVK